MLGLVLGVRLLFLAWIWLLVFFRVATHAGTECSLIIQRRGPVLVPHSLDGFPASRLPLVCSTLLCIVGHFWKNDLPMVKLITAHEKVASLRLSWITDLESSCMSWSCYNLLGLAHQLSGATGNNVYMFGSITVPLRQLSTWSIYGPKCQCSPVSLGTLHRIIHNT